MVNMKSITVRLPERLAGEIEVESRRRGISKSEIVRERLGRLGDSHSLEMHDIHAIIDVIGSVSGLPADLSTRKKDYLRVGRDAFSRPRR